MQRTDKKAMDTEFQDGIHDQFSRRTFLHSAGLGLGAAALSSLLPGSARAASPDPAKGPHFPPKIKRVIYLHQSGAPSQLETFDYKPKLEAMGARTCPNRYGRASA